MNMEQIKASFNTYFVEVIKTQYTNFSGRATRKQYWMFVLYNVIISLILGIIDGIIFKGQVLSAIWSLAVLLPSIALGVRRLHDLGKPGWWFFMILIPIVGPIALIVLFCLKGEDKKNEYGNKIA